MDYDKLNEMFNLQREFNKRVGVDVDTIPNSTEEKVKWLLNFSRVAGQEIAELIDCCPFKWWKPNMQFDEQNARVEVIDLFHFIISMAQVLGMSADAVFRAYLEKNKVNHQRQDSGYVEKDPNDCRHIGMNANNVFFLKLTQQVELWDLIGQWANGNTEQKIQIVPKIEQLIAGWINNK